MSDGVDGLPVVELYTDGACSGNPGPGGWAYLLKHPASGGTKHDQGGEKSTTNNRMELTAVIRGLEALSRPARVSLFSDSKYVLKGLEEYIHHWRSSGWKGSRKTEIKNLDLWQQLDSLLRKHELSYHWVRGHSDHPENDFVDRQAVEARDEAASR